MKAPFDSKGNLLHYPETYYMRNGEWREVDPFWAFLESPDLYRGRSAAGLTWTDNQRGGIKYPMMMTDLTYLIQNCWILSGTVGTWFEVCKRGQNYGIRVCKSLAKSNTMPPVQVGDVATGDSVVDIS